MLREALGVVNRCYEMRLGGAGSSMGSKGLEEPDALDGQAFEIKGSSVLGSSTIDWLTKISASGQSDTPLRTQDQPNNRLTQTPDL